MNRRDPTGMYNVDFHYGLTFYLALRAGFDAPQAQVIAMGTQWPDDDPARDPIKTTIRAMGKTVIAALMHGPRGARHRADKVELRARLRSDHFPRSDHDAGVVEPFSQESQQRLWQAMGTGELFLFGEGLHALQDSMSHRGQPSLFGMSGHPNERGGWTSKDTDIPHLYPRQALRAAQATYNFLVAFRNKRATPMTQPTWNEIDSEVAQFITLQERDEKKGWLRGRGVTMSDDYWGHVPMGPKEKAALRNKPFIDPETAAAMARAQAQCRCAPGF